jgi:transcriptional regulator with XRE-family HTH domain
MTLGDLVKELRMQRGLSQPELARLSSLSVGFISKIEGGYYEFTSKESIAKLARGLKVKADVLYGAFLPISTVFTDAPPRSIYEITKELQTTLVEVPVVAELHMPGEIIEYIYIPRTRPGKVNYVGVRAKGYCLEPEIMDGDTLIIDQDAPKEIGKTILCYHNDHEQPQLFKLEDVVQVKDCEIYGVVVGVFRRM